MTRPTLGHRLSGVTTWPLADSLESHIRAEQVRAVFQQSLPAQILSIVAAGIVSWVLWDHTNHVWLSLWFGLIAAITLGRVVIARLFARRKPDAEDMLRWERAFVISFAATTLAWGLGGWLIMPKDSPLHQAIVYFFLMGVAGGTVASYAAHTVATVIGVCALMVPTTIAFALQDVFELRVMAFGGALYLAAALRSTRGFGFFLRRTFQLSFELKSAYARVREQARTDELTGLANRRAFLAVGTSAVDQSKRYGRPLTLLMIDVDHFKRINDTYGHAVGDEALKTVAGVLQDTARAADTAGRLGGEEFALLLPETDLISAKVVAERVRLEVEELSVTHQGRTVQFTCSIGVAQLGRDVKDIDALLQAADESLYRAKSAGRNRVVAA